MRLPSRRPGFTLVELMISVAIAMLLVLGINTIFRITSQAVGAGESVLSCERDARTIMQTMLSDAQCVLQVQGSYPGAPIVENPAPCFVIRSEHVCAFRNANEQQTATDQVNPYHDDFLFPNFNGAHQAPVPLIHWRSHRLDRVGFFAHGNLFPRQTSSDGYSFVATNKAGKVETGVDAWITYGHGSQPNKNVILGKSPGTSAADWPGPGDGSTATNDHNFFASDWMLARMAIILNPTPAAGTDYLAYDGSAGHELTPLSAPTLSESGLTIDSARLDVANTSLNAFSAYDSTSSRNNGIWLYSKNAPGSLYDNPWWEQLVGMPAIPSPAVPFRYKVGSYMLPDPNPKVTPPPKITPYGLAKCAPNLIRGCSQFIVEYAGSFYTKDPITGTPVNTGIPKPDGQLDFVIDPATGIRQIRWYGFPRSVTNSSDGLLHPERGDVLPLRDVLDFVSHGVMLNPNLLPTPTPWGAMDTDPKRPNTALYADAEHFSGNFPPSSGLIYTNYMATGTMDPSQDQNVSTRYTYSAAWGPDVQLQPFPMMIRIIVGVDDHEGRLNQPLLFEYVYTLQQ